jgi:hypothetical protein
MGEAMFRSVSPSNAATISTCASHPQSQLRITGLREAILPALQRYWNDVAAVLRLVGRSWLLDQVNASNKTSVSH